MDLEHVNFRSFIDIDELKYLFTDFSEMTGFTIGLVDVVTNELLLGVGWRDICAKFHRVYPESEAYCKESNKRLTAGLKQVGDIRIDHCQNGLVDACTPIIVQGKHLANLFTGQVLFSPPDLEQFKSQAQKFGYDEQHYLQSLSRVPVVDEKRISSFLRYLSKTIMSIVQKNLDILNLHSEGMKQKGILQNIAELAPIGIGIAYNRTIQWCNGAMSQIIGYPDEELIGMKGETLYPYFADFVSSGRTKNKQFAEKGRAAREAQWKKKNGSLIDIDLRSAPLDGDISSGKTIFTVLDITEQNKAQNLLKQNESRLTLALKAANLGLWDWNIQTDKLFFNDNYLTMLGYEPDAFPQTLETWKMLLHPEDRERSIKAIQLSFSTIKPSWDIEFRLLSAAGDYHWILGKGEVIDFDRDGMPLRAIGIHQDITQKKYEEQTLLNEKLKYKELYDHIKSGITIYKAIENGNCFIIEERNSAARKITGVKEEEAIGRRVSEIFPELETLGILDAYRRVYKTGIAEMIPLTHYQDKKLDIWAEIYVFKISSGKIIAIYNDFTEQKQAENRMKEKTEELKQIINLAVDAFCLGDHEGTIVTVNQQATVLSGYSRDELLGQKISFLFSKAELRKSPLDFSLLKMGEVLMDEREILHKNGTTIPVEMHSKMMPDGSYQSFIRDISRRKHSQNTLLKSQRELKQKQLQLAETNTALKIVIKQIEQEKLEFEEAIATNVLSLVEPHLKQLKISKIDKSQADHIEIIESTLKNLVSPFVRTVVAMNLKLSPAEMQVANLIKQGKTSKQIADLLGLSPQTIDKHRSHIRKKIGITNKDISLRELLTSRS